MMTFRIKTKNGDGASELVLYDILGREVRKCDIGYSTGGEIYLQWDGKNRNGFGTAPGIYFYCLKTKNNNNLSGKLLRIK